MGEEKRQEESTMRADAAELAVLGALLVVPALLARVRVMLAPADFYIPAYAVLFEAMCTVFEKHSTLDLPLLRAELLASRKHSIVDEMVRLDELEFFGQDNERIEEHARAVHDASQVRALERFGALCAIQAKQPSARPLDILTWVREQLNIIENRVTTNRTCTASSLLQAALAAMHRRMTDEKAELHEMITHGVDELDARLDPIQTSEFVVLAAPPGCGKTTLGIQMALMNAAVEKGVLYISGEMPNTEIVGKILASVSEVDSRAIIRIAPDAEQFEAVGLSAERLKATLSNLELMMGRYHHSAVRHELLKLNGRPGKPRIRLVVIDSIQLCEAKHDDMQREEALGENAKGFRQIALDFDVAVVVQSAMNREYGKSKRRPQLSDLRESGSLESSATRVYFLHRDIKDEKAPPLPEEPVLLIAEKNRNGVMTDVPLTMIRRFCRFEFAG